jgi:RNA polymerase sigma-70 factor (ECF subfamily)
LRDTIDAVQMRHAGMDVDALYARHHDELLLYLVRRLADVEVALDLWSGDVRASGGGPPEYRPARPTPGGRVAVFDRQRPARALHRAAASRRAPRVQTGLERPPAAGCSPTSVAGADGRDARRELAPHRHAERATVREAVRLREWSTSGPTTRSRDGWRSPSDARARVSRGLTALAEVLEVAQP